MFPRPRRVRSRSLPLVLITAACVLAPSAAEAGTVSIRASHVSGKSVVFPLRGIAPSAVRSGRVKGPRGTRTVSRAVLRKAARRGRLTLKARTVYGSGVRAVAAAKRVKPTVVVVTDSTTTTSEPVATAPAPTADSGSSDTIPAGAFFVSPSGSDANPGTEAAPWRTIAKAAATATAGHTVVLRAGEYGAYGTRTTFSRSGAAGSPITFMGHPADARPALLGGVKISGSHLRFRHLLFDGPTGPVITPTSSNPGGEDVQVAVYGDSVEIAKSEVRDNQWHAGIYLSGADDVRIVGNYIHDNGAFARPEMANLDHGIYFGSGSGLVANNVIDHNLAFGVHIYPNGNNITVAHNTITRHGRSGVIIATTSSNNLVVNNVVALNAQNSIRSYNLTGTGNRAIRNLAFGNGGGNIGSNAEGIAMSENIQANPLFAGTTDFRPLLGSPAIDKASNLVNLADDFLGTARTLGGAPDLGAYEIG